MRKFHEIDMTDYGISKYEALELKYFCLSYPDKIKRLNELADTEELTAEQREEFKRIEKDVKAIHAAVQLAVGGQIGLYQPLLRNLTVNESIEKMPCGKNQAYTFRKRAFLMLSRIKK